MRMIWKLPAYTEFNAFMRFRNNLAWSARNRDGLIAALNILTQTMEKSCSLENTKAVNKIVKRALQFAHLGLSYTARQPGSIALGGILGRFFCEK